MSKETDKSNEKDEKKAVKTTQKKEEKTISSEVPASDDTDLTDDTLEVLEEEESTNKSKKIFGIVFIAAGLLIIATVVYFLIFPGQWRALTGKTAYVTDNTEMVADNNSDIKNNADKNSVDVIEEEPVIDEQEDDILSKVAEIEDNTKKEEVLADKEPEVKKETPKKQEANKWGLKLPCFVISHSAYSTEDQAQKIKSELAQKGFRSGYYYIPDFEKGGKPLYKVYVGPFDTRNDAEKLLASVKKEQKGAYVWEVGK